MSKEEKLFNASKNGNLLTIKNLLQDQTVDPNQFLESTPLLVACLEGHLEIVKLLITDPRIDINKPNVRELTPFWISCFQGHLDIVKHLS